MPSIFSYESAEIDWCEGNFEHSAIIAEYYNTVRRAISNLLYGSGEPLRDSLLSLALWALVSAKPGLLACIFSTYFHMTLSYVGQLLDELSILWALAAAYSFWYPKVYFPKFIKSRKHFFWLSGVTTLITTLMSFIKPALNAYVLNCIAFHLLYLTWRELKKCNDKRVHRTAAAMVVWWVLAISSWISDRWLCGFWQAINFPYFHSFWHVLIAMSLLYCCPLVIYFDVNYELPSFKPKIRYWPSDSWFVVVPYVALEKPYKQC
ncbi:Alkaline ceramidase 1 [Cuculus canorus]|uniref:Alkaline ceramidase n=1 Tax=Cuculus canorus TaxID=55661 RepID=A0A091GG40_CUCCA|nr:Alkaline ceramidase 1 [Cuculus canorus]